MNRPGIVFVALLLPILAAQARPSQDERSHSEVRASLAEARTEVRDELARARIELETENLQIGDNLQFGDSVKHKPKDELPKAEISPNGDFLIDGKALTIDAAQRRELLAYRGLIIEIAKTGIDLGERSAQAALDSVDQGLFHLLLSAMTGSLERRIEKQVQETIQPLALQLCRRMPEVRASQQRLATQLPQFRPYATLEDEDGKHCENDVLDGFANL